MPSDWHNLLSAGAATLIGAAVALRERPRNADDAPFRAELLSREQLADHARALAAEYKVAAPGAKAQPLLKRVNASAKVLFKTYQEIAEAAQGQEAITPAAEWLLDNFHIVEEQIQDIRKHLPRGYYHQLPKLEDGTLSGYPRIYALALQLIAHSDGALDEPSLLAAIQGFQSVAPLSIGELWAFAIMLRVGLVENLRRLTEPLERQRLARKEADQWSDRVLDAAANSPGEVTVVLGELAKRRSALSGAFVARLLQRLRGRGPAVAPVLDWLDRHLADQAVSTADEMVRLETQLQAADQVSISNTITSFRLLDALDWAEFFETCSLVEHVLREDPAEVYSRSDFQTRDGCRKTVEQVARRTKRGEQEVAVEALELTRAAAREHGKEHRTAHIGYWLIDKGRAEFDRRMAYSPPAREAFIRFLRAHATAVFLGTIFTLTALITGAMVSYAAQSGASLGMLVLTALLVLIPASDLAVSVTNRLFTMNVPPHVLAKLDLTHGIPDNCKTLVAIPSMIGNDEAVDELLEKLEVHYLANPDPNLHFALLTDFPDAPEQDQPHDTAVLHRAIVGVLALNERYEGENRYNRFFLFHRQRRWNEAQGCWMGWERKRGKLMELNRLIRGDENTTYAINIGDRTALKDCRFVICLDTDTQFPPDAGRKLVGTLGHPLNKAVIDESVRRVVEGYGLLQPRVSITLTSAVKSLFTRIFSGNAGVDPYTTAVSDVYQDLFGEGIFVGKGIYDIDAFEHVLEGRVAENQLLSHDLFEGSFARCALVTDIELFDDYPARYNTYSARQHRWIRGDWQLLPWLGPTVREADGKRVKNPLSTIARWKIVDNMRRSLVPAALFLLFAAGWLVLPGQPWAWTLFGLLVALFPIYAHLAGALLIDPRGVPWSSHFWNVWYDSWTNLQQGVLSLTFLAHQGYSALDAVVRTIVRVYFTRKKLLEWTTAADAERRMGTGPRSFWQRMWPAALASLAVLLAVAFLRIEALPVSVALLVAWIVSPAVAYGVSLPVRERPKPLSPTELQELRLAARRTWRFFEDLVTADEHWLPPDNWQEDRVPQVAHRTSPTNIGLLLLSTVSARDFGYLGLLQMTERLEHSLWNTASLERHRGHLFNWYETLGGTAIPPFYISTVDSGNLAGHLIALKQACEEFCDDTIFSAQTLLGLRDTVLALRAETDGRVPNSEFEALLKTLQGKPVSAIDWHAKLAEIRKAVDALFLILPKDVALSEVAVRFEGPASATSLPETPSPATRGVPHGSGGSESEVWKERLVSTVTAMEQDLETLLPWAKVLHVQPAPFGDGKPLTGDIRKRPHVFGELINPPNRKRGLLDLSDAIHRAAGELEQLQLNLDRSPHPEATRAAAHAWLAEVRIALETSRSGAVSIIQRLRALAELSERIFAGMDFSFLFDPVRNLFAVGYDVTEGRLDHYHYDLLASECRLASFVAIAKRDVPQKHWFRMGRGLTSKGGDRALVSWSGTMFEYMMPLLVMRAYEGTLLAETLPGVIRAQQKFGQRENVPWGVSESGFVARDPSMNYQYRAFGVPGLGLKPDLFEDVVIAPYATILALPLRPKESVLNLETLAKEGAACKYGYWEAIDYTPTRLQRGQRGEVVRSLMAHHQGMSLVSLGNYFFNNRMQERFHADPLVKGVDLLLQERNPREAQAAHPQTEEVLSALRVRRDMAPAFRVYHTPHTSTPRVQVLSNGRYSVMVTNAGGSLSTWKGQAVTRWREDVTRDHWGMFVYLRDFRSGKVWSAGYQPIGGEVTDYEVVFSEEKAEFHRRMEGIVSHLEIAISPEDDAEVRRLTLTNTTDQPHEIEVTSFAEIVIAPPAADQAHAAFSNLFVETEFDTDRTALLATRRPRSAKQQRVWAVHTISHEGVPAEAWAPTEYETDRLKFIGRGRTCAEPLAMEHKEPLSGTTGPVLDPIFSIRQRVRIAPHHAVKLAFTTAMASTREDAQRLAERYRDLRAVQRAFELAWTHSQVELRQMNMTPDEAHLCQRLASRVMYVDSFVRPGPEVLARNTLGQSGLWAFGVSGDLPIVLAKVSSFDHLHLVRQLLTAHEYLRIKGLQFDLVLLNEHPPGYLQTFEQALLDAARNEGSTLDQPGGVFIRRAEFIHDQGRNLLHFVARAVFEGDRGDLIDQLDWRPERREPPAEFDPKRSPLTPQPLEEPEMDLKFHNGIGGFSPDGKEYVTVLARNEWSPAPWINVVANPNFGFLASEAGSGFTWSENSRENRLTPWFNDPVSDPPGEAVFLRNDETGRVWSVTPLPVREGNPYVVRHGPGYTRYEHTSRGLGQELLLYVSPTDSVKLFRLRLRNLTDRTQRLSATLYLEWVLGVLREQTHPYVSTWRDAESGALLARNTYNGEFAQRVAFAEVSRPQWTWTSDRTEFLGRNGCLEDPRGLRRVDLAGASGAELDPCAAIQVKLAIAAGAETEVVFTVGQGADLEEARSLARKYREPAAAADALSQTEQLWSEVFGAVQVSTPDAALDLLLNRWLLYQVLACRVWARSALYQSGGAFGFRDQLQDSMALVVSRPDLTRAQLLLHAAHQFQEGDVQHWWHPPTGRGIRTRFSDDLLWLPYVTAYYVRTTGDTSVLDEYAPFLYGRPLAEGEDEYYDQPTVMDEHASLYEHCLRAIRRGMTHGAHGLPLMGTGDWNDGMNLVGNEGKGESVWVGWFLCAVLRDFAPICDARGDHEVAEGFSAAAEGYRKAIEEQAWDGEWYRRAYFDDGTPLGSKSNEECKIDSIAQTWSVISGAGDEQRQRQAMESVEKHLVREQDRLILLFTPPFDKSSLDPGYIKGYVPGVRENGGQYTHAALWTVLATAMLGKGKRAHELFTLLNPVRHGDSPEEIEQYKVEPYVVCADVYGAPPHTGRGGWTWYTGSASWMYRVGLEGLLGFHLHGDRFNVDPRIPSDWPGFEIRFNHRGTRYLIRVDNSAGVECGVRTVTLDGRPVECTAVPILADGAEHEVVVTMGG